MDATRSPAFGTLLKRYREAAGLSQERLAERTGLSWRGISDLERGVRTTPRLETVHMLVEGMRLGEADRAALLAARGANPHDRPSHERPSTGLPSPTTSLVGREPEIERIVGMLRSDDIRLVTLAGPGGVGKTRIAIEVAHRIEQDTLGGAIFVDLSPIRDPDRLLPTIATRLGIPDSGGQDLVEMLAIALRDRDMLMVLDNVEQVVDAAPDIAALLVACPSLKILVTSRIVLRITAERIVSVEPLQLPDAENLPSVRELGAIDSVALFVARARAADATFALTDKNAGDVVALVNRLDGLPLAIELAAARIRAFSPNALLARLERGLPLLSGGGRDAPERQRTMHAAIVWSYGLLTPLEQRVFRRLSIFIRGCTLEAAELVIGADSKLSDADILEALASLVDNSLIKRREGFDGDARYVMLQTVREFGIEQLRASGEEDAVREAAHAAWYVKLAREAEFMMAGPGQARLLHRLETEHENLRSDLSWLIGHDRIQDALDVSGSLWFFRWIRGYYAEARQQYELLLAHPLGHARTLERCRALIGVGVISAHQGEVGRSLQALEEAIDIARELDDPRYHGVALMCHGTAYLFVGRLEEAETSINQCHQIGADIGDASLREAALCNPSIIASSRGEWEKARGLMEECVRIGRAIGNTWGLVLGELNLGILLLRDGELDRAEMHLQEASRFIEELGDKRDLPGTLWLLADIARQRGELLKATLILQEALHVARDMGDRLCIASNLDGLAQLSHLSGNDIAALEVSREAIRAFQQCGDIVGAATCLDTVADIAIRSGDVDRAAWCIGAVDGVLKRHGMSRHDTAPGEHQSRIDTVIAALGELEYRKHWMQGHGMTPDKVLAEGLSWEPGGQTSVHQEGLEPILLPGETEIVRLMVAGMTDQEIANALQINQETLASHMRELFAKLRVRDRVEAARSAVLEGVV